MKKNIIANFIGRFWSVLSNFLFVPLYIHYLGFENYSVISFTLVIAGVMSILDGGLTATLSREFASKQNSNVEKERIFQTLEACYSFVVLLSILIVILFSDRIASNWLNLNNISPQKVSYYLKIMGFGVGFQVLARFYMGGLLGLEHQIKANILQIGWGVIRNGLVVIALIFIPTLKMFFIWQTASTIIYVVVLRFYLIEVLSNNRTFFLLPKISKNILSKVWKFAAGMLLIAIVAGLNSQLDKLFISKLLSIETLGYYTLAFALSHGLVVLVSPVSIAMLPRFTALYTENKNREAAFLFHKTFLLIAIVVFSFAVNLVFNAKEILWIWTGDMNIANEAFLFIMPLTVGMAMIAFQVIPFNIVVANGNTRLNNYIGIVSLLLTIPGYWIMVKQYGAIGAAITFCIVQTFITTIYLYFVNRLFLKTKSISAIYFKDILLPAIITVAIAWPLSQLEWFINNRLLSLIWIGLITMLTIIITLFLLVSRVDISSFINWKYYNIKAKNKHN